MSKDHIPPKCCGNTGRFTFVRFARTKKEREKYVSQNGITFSFICDECNNKMGSYYDDELGKFRSMVLELVDSKISNIVVDFNKVIKSVIGHFLASYERGNSKLQEEMRSFYIGNSNDFLDDYSLYCYYYPFEDKIFIMNEYYSKNISGNPEYDGFYSSLYFFPFAFLITEKNRFGDAGNLTESLIHSSPFVFSGRDWYDSQGKIKSYVWPADINDNNVILGGSAVSSCVIVVDD